MGIATEMEHRKAEVLHFKILRVWAKIIIPNNTKHRHLGAEFSLIAISNKLATFALTCKPCPIAKQAKVGI